MEGYYLTDELKELGLKSIGENVLISKKACFYIPEKITIGHDVRIDDYSILIGNISLGNFIHIAGYVGIHASAGSFTMEDYSTLSSRVAVYAASDDYSGDYMTNSIIPSEYTNTICSDIRIGKHVIVGTGSTILPNADLPDGVAIGAMSLIKEPLEPWGIYAGIPCKRIKERSQKCLELEKQLKRKQLDL